MSEPKKQDVHAENTESRELFLDEPQGSLLTEAMMEVEDEDDDDDAQN